MKKVILCSVASIFILVAFVVSSAFTSNKAGTVSYYEHFEYNGAGDSETDFENAVNWTALGGEAPGTSPCLPGMNRICVIRVDLSLLSTNPLLTLPEKLALFLQAQSSASDFVYSNYVYMKMY